MVELFAAEFTFPEAPVWFEDRLWVSDLVDGGLVGLTESGKRQKEALIGRRGIGGAVVTAGGRLIASGRDLVDAMTSTTLASRPADAAGMNDVGVDLDGSILVGILNYRPLAGERPVPGSVARFGPDGHIDWTWRSGLTWPNGIGALSDGTVIAADFATGRLHAFTPDDAPGRVIAHSRSGAYDGLAIDDDNNIWVATGQGATLEHRTPTGEIVDEIRIEAGFVSSVSFSGNDARRLFITVADHHDTNSGAVLTTTVDTPGRIPPHAIDLTH